MDFRWTPEHEAYRARIRAVIEANLPADWEQKSRLDTSSEYVSRFSRQFCPMLAREGLLIPHWPKDVGGAGVDAFHHWILGEEMFRVGDPRSYQYMNVNWAGPGILKYGTPRQIEAHIPGIAGGTEIWCQGFSEPNAGSDLASLRTRAERIDGGYRINGSKIWTSGASLADKCFLLARTAPERYEGISVFLVPMSTKGIEVRRIESYMGERSVHEVFFTDVEVSQDALLGEEKRGWDITKAVLHNERVGAPRYTLTMRVVDRAVELLQQRGKFRDSAVRARAARVIAACEAARTMALRVIEDRVKNRPTSPLTSLARYSLSLADRYCADFLGDYLYDDLMANEDPLLSAGYRRTGSTGIVVGGVEIQLNLIARDLLQLPKEKER